MEFKENKKFTVVLSEKDIAFICDSLETFSSACKSQKHLQVFADYSLVLRQRLSIYLPEV